MNSGTSLILPICFLKSNEIISKDVGKGARMLRAEYLLVSQVLQCSSPWSQPEPPQEAVFSQILGAGVGRHNKPAPGWTGSTYCKVAGMGLEANSPSSLTFCLDPLPLHADKLRPQLSLGRLLCLTIKATELTNMKRQQGGYGLWFDNVTSSRDYQRMQLAQRDLWGCCL